MNRVGIIRHVLSTNFPAHSPLAIAMMEALPQEELKQLLPDLVEMASWANAVITDAQQLILSLPREWVVEHIHEYTSPYLTEDTEEEWAAFLRLYELLDKGLYEKLAAAARLHPNSDVRILLEDASLYKEG